jgi:DNA-binding GntR family transcriptional regulator
VRTLSPDTPGPAHAQIATALRDAINDGEFLPGQPIPSRADLVQHFDVANMTINRAITTLKDEGLLVSRPGSGVFVRTGRPTPETVTYERAGKLAGARTQVDVYSCSVCSALVTDDRRVKHADYHQEDSRG